MPSTLQAAMRDMREGYATDLDLEELLILLGKKT